MKLRAALFSILILMNGATARASSQASDEIKDTLQEARVVPYVDPTTGKLNGYVVKSSKAGAESKQMELRQGDVLTEVNGVPLTTPEKGLEAFQNLRKEPDTRVEATRNGKEISSDPDEQKDLQRDSN